MGKNDDVLVINGKEFPLKDSEGKYFLDKEGNIFTQASKPPDEEILAVIYFFDGKWVMGDTQQSVIKEADKPNGSREIVIEPKKDKPK